MAGLEILTAGEASARPPLLFVHGAFCGAWVWAEHFLQFFAEGGWRCAAVSLSGHGASPGRDRLDRFGVADYVADVAAAAKTLDRPPILIGHSMGGLVAQRTVAAHRAAGLALLAPAGVLGLGGSLVQMSLFYPDLVRALGRVQSRGADAADYESIRRGLFSADFPLDLAMRYARMFQRESLRANLELMAPQWFALMGRPRLPTLVLGGADDRFIPRADLIATATFWGAEQRVLDGVPHAMMLDSSWRKAAEALAGWLGRSFPKA